MIQAWELHSVLDVERIMATAVTIPGQTELMMVTMTAMDMMTKMMMTNGILRIWIFHLWRNQAAPHIEIQPT